jgi:hypothetical protein
MGYTEMSCLSLYLRGLLMRSVSCSRRISKLVGRFDYERNLADRFTLH